MAKKSQTLSILAKKLLLPLENAFFEKCDEKFVWGVDQKGE